MKFWTSCALLLVANIVLGTMYGCGGGKVVNHDEKKVDWRVSEAGVTQKNPGTFSDETLRKVAIAGLRKSLPRLIGDAQADMADVVAVEVKRFGTASYHVYGRINCTDQYGDKRDSRWKVVISQFDDDDLLVSSVQLDVPE